MAESSPAGGRGAFFSGRRGARGERLPAVRRLASVGGLALALVVAVGAVRVTRRNGQAHFLATQRYEDIYYLPPPAWLQVFSLGHREALADLIWLRSLIYFGDELLHGGQVSNLYNYADAMLALDPHFKRVYSWVASCALYRSGSVTAKDARKAIHYLEQAAQLYPDDGEVAWNLGADYLYELVPMLKDPAQITEARQRGVEHLKVAALRGAGPPWLGLSTAAELDRLGQHEQEISHLQEVYAQVSDPAMKAGIEARLALLRSSAYAEALRRTDEELERARKRDFPYLDPDLYLLVGPRPPFDGTALLLRDFDPEADRFTEPSSPPP